MSRLVLRQAFLIWLGVRLFVLMGGATVGELLLAVSPLAAVSIVAVSALLVLLRLKVRGELLWLGNLGVSTRVVASLATVPAVAGELILGPWGP